MPGRKTVSLAELRRKRAGQKRGTALSLKGQQKRGARRRAIEVEAQQASRKRQFKRASELRKRAKGK